MNRNTYETELYELYTLYPEIQKLPDVVGDDNWYRYQVERMNRYVNDKAGKWDHYHAGVFVNQLRNELKERYGERKAE